MTNPPRSEPTEVAQEWGHVRLVCRCWWIITAATEDERRAEALDPKLFKMNRKSVKA